MAGKSVLALKACGEELAGLIPLTKGIVAVANPLFFGALLFSTASIGIEAAVAVTAWVVRLL